MKDYIKGASIDLCRAVNKLDIILHEGYAKDNAVFFFLLRAIMVVIDGLQRQIARIANWFPGDLHQPPVGKPDQPTMKITYSYTFHYVVDGEGVTRNATFNYIDEQVEREKILKHADSVGVDKGWGKCFKVEETVKITSEVI